jgi:hypothetical protein
VLVVAKFKKIILSIAIARPKIKQIKTIPIKPGPPSINRVFNSCVKEADSAVVCSSSCTFVDTATFSAVVRLIVFAFAEKPVIKMLATRATNNFLIV